MDRQIKEMDRQIKEMDRQLKEMELRNYVKTDFFCESYKNFLNKFFC